MGLFPSDDGTPRLAPLLPQGVVAEELIEGVNEEAAKKPRYGVRGPDNCYIGKQPLYFR